MQRISNPTFNLQPKHKSEFSQAQNIPKNTTATPPNEVQINPFPVAPETTDGKPPPRVVPLAAPLPGLIVGIAVPVATTLLPAGAPVGGGAFFANVIVICGIILEVTLL